MSDSDKPKPPTPSKQTSSVPSKQTSSVPLKKETVRVTLKAADAPMAPPPATEGEAAPGAPAAPSVPKPPTAPAAKPAPAPTIPLQSASGAPVTKPAPTIKLATPTGAGAPTIQLKSPGAPSQPAAPSAPADEAAAGSVQLPKATVQLQPTQPLGSSGSPSLSQAATIRTEDDEEEAAPETMAIVLSIVSFLGAAAVLVFQIMTASIWVEGEWDRLIQ